MKLQFIIAVMLLSFGLMAQPGSVDTTFNGGVFPMTDGDISAMVKQANGKILLAGDLVRYNGDSVPNVIRIDQDGNLDNTFALTGYTENRKIDNIFLMNDNSFMVAINSGSNTFKLIHFFENGQRDPSFSSFNNLIDDASVHYSWQGYGVSDCVQLPDGSYLACGGMRLLIDYQASGATDYVLIGVAHLSANGSLDLAKFVYSTTSNSAIRLGSFGSPSAHDIEPTGGGYLIGGYFSKLLNHSTDCILKLNSDLSVNTSFTIPAGHGPDGAVYKILQLSDGKMLIGGYFFMYDSTTDSRCVKRLFADGSIDTTFNQGNFGVSGSSLFASYSVSDIFKLNNGKFVITGFGFVLYNSQGRSTGYSVINEDGTNDTSYHTYPGTYGAWGLVQPNSIVELNNGKLLIGGNFTSINGYSDAWNLARLNTNNYATALPQIVTGNELSLYPNPASNQIFIDGLGEPTNYKLFDLNGRLLQQGNYANRESIELRDLEQGVYFIQINNNTLKFVKQ